MRISDWSSDVCSSDLFYLVDRERLPSGAPQPPISPATGRRDFGTQVYGMKTLDAYDAMLDDITRACALQEVPTGVVTAEYAAGQFEINLEHVDDLVQAADDCILFRSEEHTSELQSLMRISYAVFCCKKKKH